MKDQAAIAQLGERQTEDLEVPGSIPGLGIFRHSIWLACTRKHMKLAAAGSKKFRVRELNPGHLRDRQIY